MFEVNGKLVTPQAIVDVNVSYEQYGHSRVDRIKARVMGWSTSNPDRVVVRPLYDDGSTSSGYQLTVLPDAVVTVIEKGIE